jgi:hypothetical protein
MPHVPCAARGFTLTLTSLPGRSLMSRWKTLRYFCKVTLLAFCLRPLPHFQPAPGSEIV